MLNNWLNKNSNDHLILFFGGWGADPNPFKPLECRNFDIWMFYDYKLAELPKDFEQVVFSYSKVTLIGWSLGVWVANYLCTPHKKNITTGIAINGTLDPISDTQGIPVAIFDGTLNHLSPLNLIKFNRRMILEPTERKLFETNVPKRNWEDLRDELAALKSLITPKANEVYDASIIGSKDLIFLTDNQKNAWSNLTQVIEIEASHFLFYSLKSWSDIINLTTNKNG